MTYPDDADERTRHNVAVWDAAVVDMLAMRKGPVVPLPLLYQDLARRTGGPVLSLCSGLGVRAIQFARAGARIDNPVWDFNFGEWGMGICRWWDHLPALRRAMWRRYLEVRQIQLSTVEGLNLFYCLWDMIWLLYKRRNGEHPIPTGVGFGDSVRIYLRKLEDVTSVLKD